MGFNLIRPAASIDITINNLTPQMMNDLIVCYANDIESSDVEARFLLKERTGLEPNYPIIASSVVDEFYTQLDTVKNGVIAIINGWYHYGTSPENVDWVKGETPLTVNELKETLFFLTKRDFYESSSWIYGFTEGNFDFIKPFLVAVVDLSIAYTAGGDFDLFVTLIKENYS
jgi:hypothetical protein